MGILYHAGTICVNIVEGVVCLGIWIQNKGIRMTGTGKAERRQVTFRICEHPAWGLYMNPDQSNIGQARLVIRSSMSLEEAKVMGKLLAKYVVLIRETWHPASVTITKLRLTHAVFDGLVYEADIIPRYEDPQYPRLPIHKSILLSTEKIIRAGMNR